MSKKQIKKQSHKLVIAISSRALFDLDHSHQIFKDEGIEAYAKHQQEKNVDETQETVEDHKPDGAPEAPNQTDDQRK